MKALLIIPCYNEEENIERVYKNIEPMLSYCDYLYVNDGSKDKTGEILDQMNLRHIDLPVNLGLSGAVQMGYKYACVHGYEMAMQFDGDGQHKAEYIPQMMKEIEQGADIVIGSRFVTEKKDMSARMLGSRIISFLIKLTTGKTIKDPTSGMRMLNKKMLYDYAYNMNRRPEPDTLAFQIRKGANVKEIQVEMNDRVAGETIFNPWSSIKYMVKTCISLIFFIY